MKHISYYPYYEKLTSIITNAQTKIERQEAKKLKELNKQNSEAKSLLNTIEHLRNKLETEIESKNAAQNHIEKIQVVLAEDEDKISGLAKFADIVSKYDQIEIEISKINNELTLIDNEQRRLLPTLWVLRNTEPLLKQCKDIINSHVEEVYTAPELKYLENPSRAKLEEILYKDHRCFVCGSLVDDEHPETRDWILNRLKAQDDFLRELEDYKANIESSKRFNMFLGKIQDYPDSLLVSIESIDKEFLKMEEEVEKLKAKRRTKHEQKSKLNDQIEQIKRQHGVDPRREAASHSTYSKTIRASRSDLEREQKKLRNCEDNIRDLRNQLATKEKELKSYGANIGVVTTVEETEWKQISAVLKSICNSVQEKARKELLCNIEERANQFYNTFTQHDRGYKGTIEIGDNYSITYDAGLNTSHEDRKKMSIINALLSLNQEALGILYPFISDAPTSSFDPSTTFKYLLGIKDIFHQSIIMTKDVVADSKDYKELEKQDKVSRIYVLSSHIHRDDDREPEIYEVTTNVERLK